MSLLTWPRTGVLQFFAALLASLSITVLSAENSPIRKDAGKPAQGGELSGKLSLAGSSTMAPMMEEIGRRFSGFHPKVVIEVRAGGSRVGIDSARSGQADVGMVSRPLEGDEQSLYAFPVARDGVTFIVNRANRVHELSKAQAKNIFLGKISRWSQVGGDAKPISVFKAEEGRGATELILQYFGLRYGDLKGKMLPGGNSERVALVKENPNAIIFLSVGYAERAAAAGEPIKLVSLEGVEPSSKTVRSGDHQLARPLILVVKNLPKDLTKAFLSFALSSQSTEIIRKHDFIPYLD